MTIDITESVAIDNNYPRNAIQKSLIPDLQLLGAVTSNIPVGNMMMQPNQISHPGEQLVKTGVVGFSTIWIPSEEGENIMLVR